MCQVDSYSQSFVLSVAIFLAVVSIVCLDNHSVLYCCYDS